MLEAFCKALIKGWDNPVSPKTRETGGKRAGAVGILVNLILFGGKLLAGILAASVSMQADALNNLTDAGSSLISILSFKLSGQKADKEHPFGHARYEYIAGMAVGVIIILVGYELARSSLTKILHPEEIVFSWVSFGILAVAIVLKGFLYFFYRKVGRHISSPVLLAAASDSVSDTLATTAVLVSSVLSPLIRFNLDGYIGAAVSLIIIWAGIGVIRDALGDLLGAAGKPEQVEAIKEIVEGHEEILGIHDMILHDYGPGHAYVTLHAEVPSTGDVMALHDVIDTVEREIWQKLQVHATLHMDPVVTEDEEINALREQTKKGLAAIDPLLSMHDFRVVKGTTHHNCIFDVVIPYECELDEETVRQRVAEIYQNNRPAVYAVVNVDRNYVDYLSGRTVSPKEGE